METKQQRVEGDDHGIRIDRWFKRHFPALTHGRLEKLLRTGQVRLDGKRIKAADRVLAGQVLRLPPQLADESLTVRAEPARVSGSLQDCVLYMDTSVIVLNKPSGLATQGGSGLTQHIDGMLDSLMYEKHQRPRLVHRLDRDTSGVLVVARTLPAAASLAKSLQNRDASKIYWALTSGVPAPKRGCVREALAKEGGRGEERMTISKSEEAKRAVTDYAVLGDATEYAWVAAKPLTGRTHQIRVHLASLGTPVVGDFKYGGDAAKGKGAIADKLHLHARSIDIAHPDGGRLRVTAPLPEHMRQSFALLGFDPERAPQPFPEKRPRAEARPRPEKRAEERPRSEKRAKAKKHPSSKQRPRKKKS
jgi:23S rRNA pseudouridine955/2504/2580 synthase